MPVVSSYNPITGANVGTGDDFLVVDVSDTTQAATGTTKRITREELPSALGLGKYVAVGYGNLPTWIDPAATDWADVVANNYGWVQFAYGLGGDAVDIYFGRGDGSNYVNFFIGSDGSTFLLSNTENGSVSFQMTPGATAGANFNVSPAAGQTGPLLSIYNSLFEIKPDGSVGGVAPTLGGAIRWDGSKWVASAT